MVFRFGVNNWGKRWHFLGLVLVDFALSYLSHFELFMVQWKHVIQII
ncbi:Uncharacterised protein [Streptococcus pneumoniae]|nr:Uncharacterised protein [Streptococcus pneumoniae]CWC41727.1 Uncharacterised protein [Streptococcus pneumoniae]